MSFDIGKVLSDMGLAIKGQVGDHWNDVQSTATTMLQHQKARLELLAELRIAGDLTQEKFESRLMDQKLVVEAELNALAVLTKVIAQNAANAAMDVLSKAVTAAISAAL